MGDTIGYSDWNHKGKILKVDNTMYEISYTVLRKTQLNLKGLWSKKDTMLLDKWSTPSSFLFF